MSQPRLVRITTVPMSVHYLLRGQLVFMGASGFRVTAISADGKERSEILNDGIEHIVVPFTRKITPLRDFNCLIRLIILFKKIKPEVVHTHTPKAGLLGMSAAWICQVPVRMHTVAGLPLTEARGIRKWLLLITEKITYFCAHRIYPNSKGLHLFMNTTFTIPNSKISMIGKGSSNGIDPTYFLRTPSLEAQASEIREKHSIKEGAIVFSFVGRIVKDKGIRELVGAFSKLRERTYEVYLLLVGSPESELDPLDEKEENFLQKDDRVIMAGFQQDVRPWLMASDVFVFPSYREGFPNVVMQAACLEIPCIVSDIMGCNEIIESGVTGLIVPSKNTEALFQAMYLLHNDPVARKNFGRKSRQFVVTHFDQQYVWGEMLREYRELLAIRT